MSVHRHKDPGRRDGIIRPLWAVIDLGRVRHNVTYLKGLTGPSCKFMAVVKANAYGHGEAQVARAALSAGADCLGVALVEEAERLRDERFDCPVYLLFEPPPEGASRAVEMDTICSVYTEEFARALSEAALDQGKTALVHVKVDSGMHRVGVAPGRASAFATAIDTPRIALAPRLDLVLVPSSSIIALSISTWSRTSMPSSSGKIFSLTLRTAFSTPLPR